MKDRFDFEQEIMDCWRVVDDLRSGDVDPETLANYYDPKFEKMFKTFEQLISLGRKVEEPNPKPLPGCTRVEVIDDAGRTYVNRDTRNTVEISMQDDGKTLKVFVHRRGHA